MNIIFLLALFFISVFHFFFSFDRLNKIDIFRLFFWKTHWIYLTQKISLFSRQIQNTSEQIFRY